MGDHTADGRVSEQDDREGISRRGFIAGAAGLTGVALSGVWRGAPAHAAEAAPGRATTIPTYQFLVLDGVVVGSVAGFQGGNPEGIVAEEVGDKDPYVHKHIAGVKYQEVALKLGLGMGKPVYDWISAFTRGEAPSRNGSIITTNSELTQKVRVDFFNALVTEAGIPALDGASKEPAYMTLKFQPETTRIRAATGKLNATPSNQRAWLPANFRLEIDGLDCSRVNKIDALTLKQNMAIEKIEIAVDSLGFTMAEAFSSTFKTYFNSFVLRNSGLEKAGKLSFLNADRSSTLGSLSFANMGIFALDPFTSGEVRRVKIEMYIEGTEFKIG